MGLALWQRGGGRSTSLDDIVEVADLSFADISMAIVGAAEFADVECRGLEPEE